MGVLQIAFGTIVALGVLVSIHEYGHFWVARRCGVKVLRFSIGFGKPLFTWHDRQGTEFAIAAIPLGGYVKMLDEREAPVPKEELHLAFNRKTVWQRIAVVVAGPAANFLFAIVAYWAMFVAGTTTVIPIVGLVDPDGLAGQAGLVSGQEIIAVDGETTPTWQAVNMQLLNHVGSSDEIFIQTREFEGSFEQRITIGLDKWQADVETPDVLGGLGFEPYFPPVIPRIDEVIPDSAAAQAGLIAGDVVREIDGQAINEWGELVAYVKERPDTEMVVVVEREGQLLDQVMTAGSAVEEDGAIVGRLGVRVEGYTWPENMQREISYSLIGAFVPAVEKTWDMTLLILNSLKKMLVGLISIKNLSGPITIAKVAGDSVEKGLETFLNFLAYLSISLGLINILPIPILDGGHLMYYLAEAVRGKPVSERVQMLGLRIGISIIMALMFLALYNDISRL